MAVLCEMNACFPAVVMRRRNVRDCLSDSSIAVSVVVDDHPEPLAAKMVDLSPCGVGLRHEAFNEEMMGKTISVMFDGGVGSVYTGKIVSFNTSSRKTDVDNRVGVVFSGREACAERQPKRFLCHKNSHVYVHGEHACRFNQTVFYHVIDFWVGGMSLVGASNKNILFPGSRLAVSVLLPSFGEFRVEIVVCSLAAYPVPVAPDVQEFDCQTGESAGYRLDARFVNPGYEFLEAVSSYLVHDSASGYSVRHVLTHGFPVPDMTPVLQFSSFFLDDLSGHDEAIWNDLLDLRLRASKKSGRWEGECTPEKMIDDYDRYACHVVCRIHGKVVGAGRIVFNDNKMDRTEHARFATIPAFLKKAGFVECSRVSVDPCYQGTNIFDLVIKYMTKVLCQNGMRYALMNCADYLVPVYERYGAKQLGVRFNTPYMQDTVLNLMLFDCGGHLCGKGVSPLTWYLHWKKTCRFLVDDEYITLSCMDKLRILLFDQLGRVFSHYWKRKLVRRALSKRERYLRKYPDAWLDSGGDV